ncbi:hypothetical protein M430DRAFT_33134 [Amorphotheca resinae ATCC 22711]|uniref:Uncharacterized protein n=1 Tax=Amorphotheca resinae ATCC 22711 TaxID=857342 RepID=A0A2T3BAP7_AMORE|nr:hypothetical protein M430DRAFT_33134 [Amorphotheca resinae ATCC 22711]PSS25407.1 hypothetical protein M430DRAFT_33134 [Amorphotheca resinae ATCC 22711]
MSSVSEIEPLPHSTFLHNLSTTTPSNPSPTSKPINHPQTVQTSKKPQPAPQKSHPRSKQSPIPGPSPSPPISWSRAAAIQTIVEHPR